MGPQSWKTPLSRWNFRKLDPEIITIIINNKNKSYQRRLKLIIKGGRAPLHGLMKSPWLERICFKCRVLVLVLVLIQWVKLFLLSAEDLQAFRQAETHFCGPTHTHTHTPPDESRALTPHITQSLFCCFYWEDRLHHFPVVLFYFLKAAKPKK